VLTLDHIKRALENAADCERPGAAASAQALHATRSRQWVNCLASELKAMYPDPRVKVFFKGNAENQSEFGLDELLYDVCICETDTCPAARSRKMLRCVTSALWQVESEFGARFVSGGERLQQAGDRFGREQTVHRAPTRRRNTLGIPFRAAAGGAAMQRQRLPRDGAAPRRVEHARAGSATLAVVRRRLATFVSEHAMR
jgi:hypothetical protein